MSSDDDVSFAQMVFAPAEILIKDVIIIVNHYYQGKNYGIKIIE